jgi:hypothetical protein
MFSSNVRLENEGQDETFLTATHVRIDTSPGADWNCAG